MKNMVVSNPYIGPRSFQSEENRLFFGREKEADKLISMIIDNKIVILYGQSGAGKTSLINACLIDLLEQEEFKVLKVERIGSDIGRESNPENVFIFSTIIHLSLNGTLQQVLEKKDLSTFIKQNYEDFGKNPFVIIFDQFEEIFTTHHDRWQDREGFFYEINKLCEIYPTSRIIFVMREDYVGYLDKYSSIWNKSPYFFRLDLLNKDEALSAIKNPAKYQKIKYDINAAEFIVRELLQTKFQDYEGQTRIIEGEFIEPVQLQIVCQRLWDSLKPDEKVITMHHLVQIGGVEKVLEDFYETAIHKVLEDYSDKEQEVRDWIDKKLITPIKTRGTVLYDRTEMVGIPTSIIDSLRESYLIRLEKRAGASWISLSHDRFIDPILDSNRQWKLKNLEKAKQVQKQITQKYKNMFYALLIGIAFLIPSIIIGFNIYFSRPISTYQKAVNDYLKAKQYFAQTNYEMAKIHLLNSLRKDETEEASLLLAKVYAKQNEHNKAINQFKKTIQLAPQNAEAYFELGNFLFENGEEDESYRNFIRFFQIDRRSPRSVLSPNQFAGLIAHYFKTQINSADSSQRRNVLNSAFEIASKRVQYTYMGKNPETGFDCAGFISYILKRTFILKENESFDSKIIGRFKATTKPQPMDLMFFPAANNTVLFYLGDFFGEKLCIGIGLTAIVDIVNVGDLNYAYSFYQINYM